MENKELKLRNQLAKDLRECQRSIVYGRYAVKEQKKVLKSAIKKAKKHGEGILKRSVAEETRILSKRKKSLKKNKKALPLLEDALFDQRELVEYEAMKIFKNKVIAKNRSIAYITDEHAFIVIRDFSKQKNNSVYKIWYPSDQQFKSYVAKETGTPIEYLRITQIHRVVTKYFSKISWYDANKELIDEHNLKTKDMEYDWDNI